MTTYTVISAQGISAEQIVKTDKDGRVWFIPDDPANSDYQAYLLSLETTP
jgi:hypothetical protein